MRVEKRFHIEEVALDAEIGRENLKHVSFDIDRKRLVATNGMACAIVPCDVEPGDISGYITAESLKTARKVGSKRESLMHLQPNGTLAVPGAGVSFERPTEQNVGRFPDIDQVVPKMKAGDEGTITIGFDPELLASLSKAIGSYGKRGGIRLVASIEDRDGPMLVLPNSDRDESVVGVIMPQRFK